MKDYKELIIWQKSIELVGIIYALTKNFPKEELFGITNQMRSSAISIPSNIAEGSQRKGGYYAQFLSISRGSVAELETQIIISHKLGYLDDSEIKRCNSIILEIRKMLTTMIQKVKAL